MTTNPGTIGEMGIILDAQHPWPGLHAFSLENRAHFRGRDGECDDLIRRVRRKLLTVLFSVSGLGKTSLLQAGLVPTLKSSEFVPILIRLDHNSDAIDLLEQVREAIRRGIAEAGITRTRGPDPGENLWSFFHRRNADWLSAEGKPRNAVLIFDQFEEIFARARRDSATDTRRRHFLTSLAELVENRPPDELRDEIEQNPDLLERYDFSRQDYRVVLSLREDFLPELEDLKRRMPSVMENRLRITRMSEPQALEAILQPGRDVVDEAVAREIVAFITGSSDSATVTGILREVDPALLSLMCAELNAQRLAEGMPRITSELLQGRSTRILDDYYFRCFDFLSQAERSAVQSFLEERLLTQDGHRDSVALDSAQNELIAQGVPAGALDELVKQRLLQFDERHGLKRVELAHDILTTVVDKHRAQRHQREELENARRQEQEELEEAKRRQQRATEQLMQMRKQRRKYAITGAVFAVLFTAASLLAVVVYVQKERLEATEAARQEALEQAERNAQRAEKALADLKKTAPVLRHLADTEAGFQRFDSAIEKLDAAIALEPDHLPSYWRRSSLFIGAEKFAAGAEAFRLAQKKDPAGAKQVSILSVVDELAAAPPDQRWTPERSRALSEYLREIGANAELTALSRKMQMTAQLRAALVAKRLEEWLGEKAQLGRGIVVVTPEGQVRVLNLPATIDNLEPLRGLPIDELGIDSLPVTSLEPLRGMSLSRLDATDTPRITDLTPLTGMPLRGLNLTRCKIGELKALSGMPLESLSIAYCKVRDLSPLRGLPLRKLDCSGTDIDDLRPLADVPLEELSTLNTRVHDLSPLRGKALRQLNVKGCPVVDLAPLRGMPIERLEFSAGKVRDFSPLLDLPRLEHVVASDHVPLVETLRRHPTLKTIQLWRGGGGAFEGPVAEVWAKYDAEKAREAK